MKRLGLIVNGRGSESREFAEHLIASAGRFGLSIVEVDDPSCELVIAAGGDGTVLKAADVALERRIPVLGFDLGTLGFLAEADPNDLDRVLAAVHDGDYQIEERLCLQAAIGDKQENGLNDVVVEKIESQRLVVLGVEVDGAYFLSHRADGLVIATSTGSTAYAFSAGGPLIDPALDSIQVVPVAPHSLFDRSLVLPPSAIIRVTVERDRPVRVSVDGREIGTMKLGESVEVRSAQNRLGLVRIDNEVFTSRVTRKLRL